MAVSANKRSVMILYSEPKCPFCHRVRLVLAEKGISYDLVEVDYANLPDELMDFNPYGTVPTLVDRELRLYESRIIMEYLDERFPHPPLLPVDPVSRASSRLYMYRVDRDWFSLAEQIKKGREAEVLRARKELRESLISTAPVFSAKPFFMSDEFSLVDCTLAPLLWRLPALGVELPPQARAIHDYTARIFERPGFVSSLTEDERDMRDAT